MSCSGCEVDALGQLHALMTSDRRKAWAENFGRQSEVLLVPKAVSSQSVVVPSDLLRTSP